MEAIVGATLVSGGLLVLPLVCRPGGAAPHHSRGPSCRRPSLVLLDRRSPLISARFSGAKLAASIAGRRSGARIRNDSTAASPLRYSPASRVARTQVLYWAN